MKEASPNGWLDNGRIETKAVLYLMTIRALRNTEYVTHAQSRNLVRRNERISPSAERKLKWRREVDWAKTEMRREATTRLRPDWRYDSTVFETSKKQIGVPAIGWNRKWRMACPWSRITSDDALKWCRSLRFSPRFRKILACAVDDLSVDLSVSALTIDP